MSRLKTDDEGRVSQLKFLSLIANEIKLPLQHLASLLKKHSGINTGDGIRPDLVHTIVEHLKASNNVLDSMILWSRVQMKGREVFEPVLLKLQTDNVISSTRYLNVDKKIKIYNEVPDIGLVSINLALFEFLLRNLLTNAINYSGAKASIYITCTAAPDKITIAVKDNGPGIDAEILHSLSKEDVAVKAEAMSGLYLCKDLLNRFNGRIWAENNPEEGATIYFSLPYFKSE